MKIMLCLEWLTCLQWNPVNRVTDRPKKLAVFTGDHIIPRGFFTRNVRLFCLAAKKKKKEKEKLNTCTSNANFLFFPFT